MDINFNLQSIYKEYDSILDNLLDNFQDELLKNVQDESPYDTGALASSIAVNKGQYNYRTSIHDKTDINFTVSSDLKYSGIQNEKTNFVQLGFDKTLNRIDVVLGRGGKI